MFELRHRLVVAAKSVIFGRRGEPYEIEGKTLRFVPGTRPVRLQFRDSTNVVNRYDALQLTWMLDNLSKGDFVIDVGANCGQCTIIMAEKCGPTGSVIAFEPNPDARALLNRNFDLNPGIKRATVEAVACSDTAGEAEFYENGNAANSALMPLSGFDETMQTQKSSRVPVTTVDAYLAGRALPVPRCVKIDTEGAEIRILQGARDLLSSSAAILCELHPYAWPQFGNSLQELRELLAQHGRRMRYLDRNSEASDEVTYGIVALERRNDLCSLTAARFLQRRAVPDAKHCKWIGS